jgi:hypothetical protein
MKESKSIRRMRASKEVRKRKRKKGEREEKEGEGGEGEGKEEREDFFSSLFTTKKKTEKHTSLH